MRFNAVIFDLDGTLLNTLEDLADAMNRVLLARGFPTHLTEKYRYFIGSGVSTLVSRALPPDNRNDTTISGCLRAFRKDYASNWKVKTRPYDGVPELLNALIHKQVKLAILSNKPHDFTQLCVRDFFAKWDFAAVNGQKDGIPEKPDPTGALEIARGLLISPENFIYVGDSDIDMLTAVRAGMFPVGVLWGFRSEKELRENGAMKTIRQPMDLLPLFV